MTKVFLHWLECYRYVCHFLPQFFQSKLQYSIKFSFSFVPSSDIWNPENIREEIPLWYLTYLPRFSVITVL